MKFTGTDSYVASDDLRVAVNASIALERPLLIKGEPGTGKTMLAEEVSSALGLPLLQWHIKSTTKAQMPMGNPTRQHGDVQGRIARMQPVTHKPKLSSFRSLRPPNRVIAPQTAPRMPRSSTLSSCSCVADASMRTASKTLRRMST